MVRAPNPLPGPPLTDYQTTPHPPKSLNRFKARHTNKILLNCPGCFLSNSKCNSATGTWELSTAVKS